MEFGFYTAHKIRKTDRYAETIGIMRNRYDILQHKMLFELDFTELMFFGTQNSFAEVI